MFITSVVMVVVMAIALTTSSLAWFTASGAATVSTDSLTLTAKANVSTGIQITDDMSSVEWASSISFDPMVDLAPILPYKYDSDSTTLEEALINNKFIGNTVDENVKFKGEEGTLATSSDYFVSTDIFVTNMAQGSGAKAVSITPTIAFTKGGDAYAPNATANRKDPNLCVAVLCNNTSYRAANGSYDDSDADWELVKVFNSKGQETVKFGKTEDAFAEGEVATDCFTNLNINSGSGLVGTQTATNTIDPIAVYTATGEYGNYGEVVQFKVIAWYDGVSLVNSNSGTALQFTLTFTAAAVS